MMARHWLLLCFLIGVCCCEQLIKRKDGLIRIPVLPMESGLERLLREGADLKLIEGLYEMAREKSYMSVDGKPKPVPSNDTLPLFKYFQTQYYGLINIGKPGKPFRMVLDSAWGYSWLPSAECPRTCLPCAIHAKYNHKESSTYKPNGKTFNVSNRFVGYMSQDVFHAGHLNATGQFFAELTLIPWMFAIYQTDGTLGLGQKGLALAGMEPFFYNFYTQNKIQPIFSLFVNRDPTTPRGGSLFLGGIDYKHNKTEFTPVDITSDLYWQFDMDRVTLVMSKKSKEEYCTSGCKAYADTSSNTIVGPAADIKNINRLIGAEEIFFSDRYMIPCVNVYKGPKVSFRIKGKEFEIKALDYIQQISYSGLTVCLSAFQPAGPNYMNNTWSLGGAFLYRFYTAFDVANKKMLIAEAT